MLLSCLFCANPAYAKDDQNLPTLGDYTSGIISLEQEYALGQEFMRSIRSQAPLAEDPVLQEYTELLIYRLASHSQLQDKRLELAIIDDKTINAFAAPGGIVGINLGLFLFGESESEVSAILSHELAHLSQRHFARRSEASKKAGIKSMLGIFASILLMITAGTDAGLAALSGSQALAQAEMLGYSRSRETEADRLGIETLVDAGLDARAMAVMFERLNRSKRFNGRDVPEFLLTHPVTQRRIADSYTQVELRPYDAIKTSLDYQLMRAKVQVMTDDAAKRAIARMKDKMNNPDTVIATAGRYGLALAQTKANKIADGRQTLRLLRRQYPGKIAFIVAEANLYLSAAQYANATDILAEALAITPQNYPLSMTYAKALIASSRWGEAVEVLQEMTLQRPVDKDIWYLLAEARGLSRDIIGVHQARAEYFALVGNFEQAIKQLTFATSLVRDNFQQNARVQTRMAEIRAFLQEK